MTKVLKRIDSPIIFQNVPRFYHHFMVMNNFLKNGNSICDRDGIKKVEGHIIDKTFQSQNGTFYTKPVITAIRFTSFKDVPSPIYNQSSGIRFTESFQGYRLGYVTGRSNEYIEQIQFIWYRN